MLSEKYTLGISQTANIFFGRSRDWLDRMEKVPMVLPSGRLIETPHSITGRRVYTLEHINDMTAALLIRGNIKPARAAQIFELLIVVSALWEG